MATLHTGHDEELVHIKTDKFMLTIKGPTCHPRLGGRNIEDKMPPSVSVACKEKYEVYFLGSDTPSDTGTVTMDSIAPLFFEQQDYVVVLQYPDKENVEFWHDNISIRENVTDFHFRSTEEKPYGLKTGRINFRNNIGFSDLVILVDGKKYLTLTVEVYPIKLDYKKDYLAIMDDLSKELYNLVFEFLRETYHGYHFGNHSPNSLVEFLAIIECIYCDYIKAIEAILRHPHHVLQTDHMVVRTDKAKRFDRKSIRWIEKHPDCVSYDKGKIFAEKVLTARKEIIYDTRENQFVKFILQSTVKRLKDFKRNYLALDRVKYNEPDQKGVIDPINRMISGINSKLNMSFLKEVSDFKGQGQLSLVFSMATGYKELYCYHILLQHGLDLSGDILHMSLKDLAELYEYWCFIKLNCILANNYHLIGRSKIKTNRNGLFVTLAKNKQESKVVYKTEDGEQTITLFYNASFKKNPTGPQKPDNTLSICKSTASGKKEYQYIFDAKYRMNPANPGSYYKNTFKGPGPEEDDINAMHRYRDAIVSLHEKERPWERLMFGAFVLFPLSKPDEDTKKTIEDYKEHIFFKSIEDINIGGLPFLPSSTELVENLLKSLVEDSPADANDRVPSQKNMDIVEESYKTFIQLTTAVKEKMIDSLEYKTKVDVPGRRKKNENS